MSTHIKFKEVIELFKKLISSLLAVIITIVLFTFIFSSCSQQNWEYIFQGESQNWVVELEIKPDNFFDVPVGYFISLEKINDKEVKNVQYELNINDISFHEAFIKPEITLNSKTQVGGTSPGTMEEAQSFHKGMSDEELESVLKKVEFTIKWEDIDGNHEEIIVLKSIQ